MTAYTKTAWVSSTAPGISAGNLNNLESQYGYAIGGIGDIIMYGGTTAPTDFLLCDGSSYNSATYSQLFSVTSYFYGGSLSTFRVPDLRGRFAVGYSGAGDYATLGSTGGSSNMPAHIHGGVISVTYEGWTNGNLEDVTPFVAAGGLTYTASAGAGPSSDNRPQYLVLNFIIRYQS